MPNARPCRTSRSSSSDAVLAELVVLDEELLELVDHQQHRGSGTSGLRIAEPGDVLHPVLAEQFAALLQHGVEPLQRTHAELAIAFDGDDVGMRQSAAPRSP